MPIPVKLFQQTTKEEKIEFFLQCQKLLMEHHPHSPFLFTTGNVDARMTHIRTLLTKYHGLVYMDDNICVLFNRIRINEGESAPDALKNNIYSEPHPDYNAVSVDFVVFRDLKDCAEWVKSQYDPRIQHVLYVKNNQPFIYKTEKIIAKIFQMPLAQG
jgi:hypothetical protein